MLGSVDMTICVWDAQTGGRPFHGNTDSVHSGNCGILTRWQIHCVRLLGYVLDAQVSQIDWFSLSTIGDIGDIQGGGGWHPSQK